MREHPSPSATSIAGPRWDVPARYGEPAAHQGMGSVAAPLLAGFSLTFLGLVIQGEDKLRYPSLAILLLTITSILFVFAVQSTFWARLYWFTPTEAEEWWPDFRNDPQRRERIREEQWSSRILYRRWSVRARRTYNSAIVMLYTALAVALIPNQAVGSIAIARWVAILTAAIAAIIEFLGHWAPWIMADERGGWIDWIRPVVRLAEFLSPPLPRMKPPPERHHRAEQ
jgi:hypothetical protein